MLPSCDLPGDVIVGILLKLPVESLLRFKLVCKPWNDFISSPNFIQLHLRRPVSTHHLLVLSDPSGDFDGDNDEFSLLTRICNRRDADDEILSCKVPQPFPLESDVRIQILDSCNGLVCLGVEGNDSGILLWNPATRKFRSLEFPNCNKSTFSVAGLGYIEATNDYKIVGITHFLAPGPAGHLFGHHSLDYDVWIYNLSLDSWKKLNSCFNKLLLQPRPPILVNGHMHWLTNRYASVNRLVAFDLAEEVTSYYDVPDDYGLNSRISRQLMVIKASLSIIVFSESYAMRMDMEIWVMAEYGDQGTWSKQIKLQELPMVARPLGSWKDGELLLRYETEGSKKLMFCDLFSKRKKYFPKFEAFSFQAFNYVESLESVEWGRR